MQQGFLKALAAAHHGSSNTLTCASRGTACYEVRQGFPKALAAAHHGSSSTHKLRVLAVLALGRGGMRGNSAAAHLGSSSTFVRPRRCLLHDAASMYVNPTASDDVEEWRCIGFDPLMRF